MIDFKALAAPFPPNEIEWRIGATNGDRGLPLAYLTARHVMDRLDDVCTPAGWQCRYPTMGHVTICEIGIKIGDEWIWKADGAGASDVEAEKGILSDAFKRAGYRWAIGRYLYAVQAPWVEIEKRGKTSVIAKHEYDRLEKILAQAGGGTPTKPTLPPADSDVERLAERWFRTQKEYLEGCKTVEAIAQWAERENRALGKLKLQHRDLWDLLDLSQQTMLDKLGGLSQ